MPRTKYSADQDWEFLSNEVWATLVCSILTVATIYAVRKIYRKKMPVCAIIFIAVSWILTGIFYQSNPGGILWMMLLTSLIFPAIGSVLWSETPDHFS